MFRLIGPNRKMSTSDTIPFHTDTGFKPYDRAKGRGVIVFIGSIPFAEFVLLHTYLTFCP